MFYLVKEDAAKYKEAIEHSFVEGMKLKPVGEEE